MTNRLLEHEEKNSFIAFSSQKKSPLLSLLRDENLSLSPLIFEWQTDDDASDCLRWRGDIDQVLGFPEGAFPRTFSAWVDALHPDDRNPVLGAIEAHLASGEPYRVECRAHRRDGEVVRWTHSGQSTRDENGNPIKLTGTLELVAQTDEHAQTNGNNGVGLNGSDIDCLHVDGLHLNGLHLNGLHFDDLHANGQDEAESAPIVPAPAEVMAPAEVEVAPSEVEVAPSEAAAFAVGGALVEVVPASEVAAGKKRVSKKATGSKKAAVASQVPVEALSESAEQRAQGEQARAQALLRTAAHLNAQLDLQDVCEAICEEAAITLNAPSAVMLFNKTRDAFVPTAVRGMPVDYDKRYIPTSRSIYDGHVAEMGTLFLFTDAQATPDLPNHKLYQEVNMRTIGIASLIREGEVLGLLKVYSFVESRTFNANELALLQGLADQAAQAIANARLLAESERRLANLNALREIDKAILGSSDVGVALGVVLDQVVARLGADAASALLLNAHTRTLRYAAGRGFRTSTPRRTDWQLGEGLAGRAALERRVIHVPDLSRPDLIAADFTDPELKLPGVHRALDAANARSDSHAQRTGDAAEVGVGGQENEEQNGRANTGFQGNSSDERSPFRRTGIPSNEGFASYHGVPLVANGQVKGVLEVWHRAPLHLDEEEMEFLETLASQAAIAVDNATLFRDLQRSNDELVLAYDSTLAGWSGALDLRDKETEGHSERVTRETLRLAREMGLGDAELVHIRRGALLHDIGKMGVPDAILLKPGPLSDEEWAVMKQHPAYALQLLSPIEYLRPTLDIPYAHHEKWDGTGYPRGLCGEQIPRAARLFAVVDVWDALCSDRPYRKGWPVARVLNHIRDGSGTHFDPAVVEAFLRLHADELREPERALAPEPERAPEPEPQSALAVVSEPERRDARRAFWPARLLQSLLGGNSS